MAPGPESGHDLSGGRPVIEGYFLSGSDEVAEKLMETAYRDDGARSFFEQKNIEPKPASSIIV